MHKLQKVALSPHLSPNLDFPDGWWSGMSGRRASGTSRPSLGAEVVCPLFHRLLRRTAVQIMSGKLPGSPRHLLPDIRDQPIQVSHDMKSIAAGPLSPRTLETAGDQRPSKKFRLKDLPCIFIPCLFRYTFTQTLKTLTSLNKEVRPFFLGDNSIWSYPFLSSLSDCSIWRS